MRPPTDVLFSIEHDLRIIAMSDTVIAGSRSVLRVALSIERMSGLCDVARVPVIYVSVSLRALFFLSFFLLHYCRHDRRRP